MIALTDRLTTRGTGHAVAALVDVHGALRARATGAADGDKGADRLAQRNGCHDERAVQRVPP